MTDDKPQLETTTKWTPGSTDDLLQVAASLLRLASLHGDRVDDFVPAWTETYATWQAGYQAWGAQDAEETCHKCGWPFIHWSAPSPLWNEVMRGGDINAGPEPYMGIICPSCFMQLTEEAGIATGWRVYAATVFRILPTVTPSGRVWNPETWLYDDPAPPVPPLAELPAQDPR